MQARQDTLASIAAEKEARLKANYKKAKAFWYSKGIVFSVVSKDNDRCIKPRQYQMSLTASTNGP